MKPQKTFLLLFTIISLSLRLTAWTSSNEGVCYTMDTLCMLSDSISYNIIDEMYEVDCDIVILENDTLNILAGERVIFISYNYPPYRNGIIVFGCFLAQGTKDLPIHLGDPETTFTTNSGYWWNGIEILNTSKNGESIIKYCTLRGVTHINDLKETAIYCENSSPIIDHCTILYMGTDNETGGCSAIGLVGQSYPIVSYCTFKNIMRGVAIWCNPHMFQDTINYPSPLIYGCNIKSSIQGIHWPLCDFDIVVLYGGFLDNCYIGVGSIFSDTTLGYPIDTIGDGICTTTSTNEVQQKFYKVDGVVNPRGDTLITGINEDETNILPTTTKYISLKENYPNPFSAKTTIEFDVIYTNKSISLYIYNSKGNLVNKLINNKKYRKGNHSIIWKGDNENGSPVPKGIYFYKLFSDSQMLVKKAIVVKS